MSNLRMTTSTSMLSRAAAQPIARAALVLIAVLCTDAEAKMRWSALQLAPDADLISGGDFVVAAPMFYGEDSTGKSMFRPAGLVYYGIGEWVNVMAGYAGGVTCGFKARILNENSKFMPTLTIGSHNIIAHRETYLFGAGNVEGMNNEFFLGLAKTVEPVNTRFHLGLQTIPALDIERWNPYFAVEKYFGVGLYATIEVHRRGGTFHPSMFLAYRFLKRHIEVFAGLVELRELFTNPSNQFEFSLDKPNTGHIVRPGIMFGLRFNGKLGLGSVEGLKTVDDDVRKQKIEIEKLNDEIAQLRLDIDDLYGRGPVADSLARIDSAKAAVSALKAVILAKLNELKALHAAAPFQPDKARSLTAELVGLESSAVQPLREIVAATGEDRQVRALAISVLGDIGDKSGSDVLLDLLSQSADPDLRIEALIAIGKMHETRALPIVEKLASDIDDAVAYTAREVLRKLNREPSPADTAAQRRKAASPKGPAAAPSPATDAAPKTANTTASATPAAPGDTTAAAAAPAPADNVATSGAAKNDSSKTTPAPAKKKGLQPKPRVKAQEDPTAW